MRIKSTTSILCVIAIGGLVASLMFDSSWLFWAAVVVGMAAIASSIWE